MEIRKGTLKDLEAIAAVEAACFPAAEAATAEEFAGRLQQYGNHFWLLWEGERLLAFVDGFCTDWPDLTDEMYADASLHRENGAWQMIFGVNTIPACRRQGYAGQLPQQAKSLHFGTQEGDHGEKRSAFAQMHKKSYLFCQKVYGKLCAESGGGN